MIIFDEPTSSLSQHEAEHFYTLLDRLKARDVTCVFVSHRMQEIYRLCDTITVLRDGRHVATGPIGEIDEAALVQLMIGRRLEEYLPDDTPMAGGGEVLRVAELSSPRKFADISFSVHASEVVGIAGLVGAGRTDIAHAIFGLDPEAHGRVEVAGIPLGLRSPAEAMRAGVGFVPEDRKRHGLVLSMRALENVTLPTLRSIARAGWLRAGAEQVAGGRRVHAPARAHARSRRHDRRIVGRQSAEAGAGEVAGGPLPRVDPRRAHPRRRRRREGGDPRAHRAAGGGGNRRVTDIERAAGAGVAVVARPRVARRASGR